MYPWGRLNYGSQRYPHPNPWNLRMLPLGSKRDFANMVELRILRWGDYPGLCGWVLNEIISVLKERQKEI